MEIRTCLALLLAALLTGCGILPNADRDAYKKAERVKSLEEPPGIILPERDATYNVPDVQDGAVSKKASDKDKAPSE